MAQAPDRLRRNVHSGISGSGGGHSGSVRRHPCLHRKVKHMRDKIVYGLGIFAILLLARNIYVIAGLPPEANQGAIFKIIFFHATMAITALTGSFVAFAASALFLITKNFFWDDLAVAVTEVG